MEQKDSAYFSLTSSSPSPKSIASSPKEVMSLFYHHTTLRVRLSSRGQVGASRAELHFLNALQNNQNSINLSSPTTRPRSRSPSTTSATRQLVVSDAKLGEHFSAAVVPTACSVLLSFFRFGKPGETQQGTHISKHETKHESASNRVCCALCCSQPPRRVCRSLRHLFIRAARRPNFFLSLRWVKQHPGGAVVEQ